MASFEYAKRLNGVSRSTFSSANSVEVMGNTLNDRSLVVNTQSEISSRTQKSRHE